MPNPVKERLHYRDREYAKITIPDETVLVFKSQPLFYSLSEVGLLLTFNEEVLKRHLDRVIARQEAARRGDAPPIPTRPWLGESAGMQFNRKLLSVLGKSTGGDYRSLMQGRCWDNLPILNEWHRRFPDQDPVELHERIWRTRLVCPSGGVYVWNDAWQTMESTVYGHPGEPKRGPEVPPLFDSIEGGNLGLTFENQGLRAKAVLERTER
jgi:hypothetical protein